MTSKNGVIVGCGVADLRRPVFQGQTKQILDHEYAARTTSGRGSRIFSVIAVVLFLCSSFVVMISLQGKVDTSRPQAYTSHGPIVIDDDASLLENQSIEKWPGTGTLLDPILIEGYDIGGAGWKCIFIGNTTLAFEIRDCYLHDGDCGLYLENVVNGLVNNNTCSGNDFGIQVASSSGNVFVDNNCSDNREEGLDIYDSESNTLENNLFANNPYGIYAYMSSWCVYTNNTFSNNKWDGIGAEDCADCEVNNNTFTNNALGIEALGIELYYATDWVLKNNTFSGDTLESIYCYNGNSCTLANNTMSCSDIGIDLYECTGLILRDNLMYDTGIMMGGSLTSWTSNDIGLSNLVNGKPVRYLVNQDGIEVSGDAGQIILGQCSNMTIRDYVLGNSTVGIQLGYSSNNTIAHCDISHCSEYGVYLLASDNNVMENNTCSNNSWGIYVVSSDGTRLENNTLWCSCFAGITLANANGAILRDNALFRDGVYIDGGGGTSWASYDIDTSNQVNGKPIYYFTHLNHGTVPGGAGQVILIECSYMVVENQVLDETSVGILQVFSMYNWIANNSCSGGWQGIKSFESDHNTLFNNTCSNNIASGMDLSREGYFVAVKNNTCLSNGEYGLRIGVQPNMGKPDYDVENNTCSDNLRDGIQVWGYVGAVKNNTCLNNSGYGIFLYYYDNNNLVADNVCSKNAYAGIGVHFGGSTLKNNTCSENKGYGVALEAWSSSSVVTGCLFLGNGLYGVYVDHTSSYNRIFNNTFGWNNGSAEIYNPEHIQARDDGQNNSWNATEYGNYWLDWSSANVVDPPWAYDVPYDIAGSAASQDKYPLVSQPVVMIPEFSSILLVTLALMCLVVACGLGKRHS